MAKWVPVFAGKTDVGWANMPMRNGLSLRTPSQFPLFLFSFCAMLALPLDEKLASGASNEGEED